MGDYRFRLFADDYPAPVYIDAMRRWWIDDGMPARLDALGGTGPVVTNAYAVQALQARWLARAGRRIRTEFGIVVWLERHPPPSGDPVTLIDGRVDAISDAMVTPYADSPTGVIGYDVMVRRHYAGQTERDYDLEIRCEPGYGGGGPDAPRAKWINPFDVQTDLAPLDPPREEPPPEPPPTEEPPPADLAARVAVLEALVAALAEVRPPVTVDQYARDLLIEHEIAIGQCARSRKPFTASGLVALGPWSKRVTVTGELP